MTDSWLGPLPLPLYCQSPFLIPGDHKAWGNLRNPRFRSWRSITKEYTKAHTKPKSRNKRSAYSAANHYNHLLFTATMGSEAPLLSLFGASALSPRTSSFSPCFSQVQQTSLMLSGVLGSAWLLSTQEDCTPCPAENRHSGVTWLGQGNVSRSGICHFQ